MIIQWLFNDYLIIQPTTPGSAEDFDFFTTTGDNIYPHDEKLVTENEMRETMNLFQDRSAISNLPIYPVRGNHDCYFDD